jgi:hypothetical protein
LKLESANLNENEVIELFDKKQQEKLYDKGLPHIHSMDNIS